MKIDSLQLMKFNGVTSIQPKTRYQTIKSFTSYHLSSRRKNVDSSTPICPENSSINGGWQSDTIKTKPKLIDPQRHHHQSRNKHLARRGAATRGSRYRKSIHAKTRYARASFSVKLFCVIRIF